MKIVGWLLVCTFVLAAALNRDIYRNYGNKSDFSQLLYLPSGKYLKPVALGYDSVLADFVYLWSIQYFSFYGSPERSKYIKHTYEIITELDPKYVDAYETGALFLFFEGKDPRTGLDLLETGFARNPTEWVLPTDAGFYCWLTLKDYKQARFYFAQAVQAPGAPVMLRRMLAATYVKLGEKQQAYILWREIYEMTDKPTRKRIAGQHMRELRILMDIERLQKAIDAYRAKYGTNPLSLGRLVNVGLIENVPLDPDGNMYDYDPARGKVKSATGLVLYKSPQ